MAYWPTSDRWWMPAMTSGVKVWLVSPISVGVEVGRVEVVQGAGRGHPFDVARLDVVEPGPLDQVLDGQHVVVVQLLDAGVGAEGGDGAGHVDDRFVQRVAEARAGVATDQDGARLGHEGGH